MKKTLCAMLAATAAWLVAAPVPAQNYPSKPVKIEVGFAAGGPTDVIARIVAQDMSATLNGSFIVENKPGANAIIATDYVAAAAPDGYTLLYSSLSLMVNAILEKDKIKYDPFKSFTPIGNGALLPMVIVTSPETKITSLAELIARAKAKPEEVTYGTSGHGGSSHLAGAMLGNMIGAKMTAVQFKGNGPALLEVMAGRVTFMFYPAVGIANHVRNGKLKVLAVGTKERIADFPDAPTFAELGYPELEGTAPWVGLLAPAGTPAAIIKRLNEAHRNSIAKPETKERFKVLGAVPVGDTPEEFAAFLKKDYEHWARVIKASGISSQ